MILAGPVEFDSGTILLLFALILFVPVALITLCVVGMRSTWRAVRHGNARAQTRALTVVAIELLVLASSGRFGNVLVQPIALMIWLNVVVLFVAVYERLWPQDATEPG